MVYFCSRQLLLLFCSATTHQTNFKKLFLEARPGYFSCIAYPSSMLFLIIFDECFSSSKQTENESSFLSNSHMAPMFETHAAKYRNCTQSFPCTDTTNLSPRANHCFLPDRWSVRFLYLAACFETRFFRLVKSLKTVPSG